MAGRLGAGRLGAGRAGAGFAGLAAALGALLWAGAAYAADHIDVGVVAAMGRAPEFIAQDKGYYKELGLDVNLEPINSTARAAAANADGSLPILGGGISVGFFNSLAAGFHIKLMLEGGSTPIGANLMVRPDLVPQLKTLADLKGRSIDVVAPGSVNVYLAVKLLAAGGLTTTDVELKYVSFGDMPSAFINKAIDTAIAVQPTVATLEAKGFAAKWIDPDDIVRPTPMLISGTLVNTDWAARNPDVMRRFFVAVARGIRDYCTAYHDGPNRREVIDVLTRNTPIKDPDFLDRTQWLSRQASGEVPIDSLLDILEVFFHEGLIKQKFTADQLVDMTWIRAADKTLGPYAPPAGSTKPGCR